MTPSAFLALIGLTFAAASCSSNDTPANTTATAVVADSTAAPVAAAYSCPMHPRVVSNAPGQCPDCGMDLVKQ